MLSLLVAVAMTSSEPAAVYAAGLQSALESVGAVHLKTERQGLPPDLVTATFVLHIDAEGHVQTLITAVPGLQPRANDLARSWIFATEPFAPLPTELAGANGLATCIVRVSLTRGVLKSSPILAACFAPDNAVAHVSNLAMATPGEDAGFLLLRGYERERALDLEHATQDYEASLTKATSWSLPSRALALVLFKQKRAALAVPHMRRYVESQLQDTDAIAYARELERYDQERAAKAAEFNKPRRRLSQADLLLGAKKGYALLEPCMVLARAQKLVAVGADTLVATFKIQKDGSVSAARLDAPEQLALSEQAQCFERVIGSWRFPPFVDGQDLVAKRFPLKVRGQTPPQKPTATESQPATTPLVDEPMFAQCERSSTDIGRYIETRKTQLMACIQIEQKRTKGAGWPSKIDIDFVIDTAGPIRNVGIRHRAFRNGPLQTCVAQALAGTLAASDGADCPGEFGVELGAFVR